jgi:hypothetical protein
MMKENTYTLAKLANLATAEVSEGQSAIAPTPAILASLATPTAGIAGTRSSAEPLQARIAELIAAGYAPWNARAQAEQEAREVAK